MRRLWGRLQAWLRREAYVQAVIAEATKRAYLDGHHEGMTIGHQAGYQIGRAHGELIGRDELALEIQQAHGIGGGERAMAPDQVATLRVKQLH